MLIPPTECVCIKPVIFWGVMCISSTSPKPLPEDFSNHIPYTVVIGTLPSHPKVNVSARIPSNPWAVPWLQPSTKRGNKSQDSWCKKRWKKDNPFRGSQHGFIFVFGWGEVCNFMLSTWHTFTDQASSTLVDEVKLVSDVMTKPPEPPETEKKGSKNVLRLKPCVNFIVKSYDLR